MPLREAIKIGRPIRDARAVVASGVLGLKTGEIPQMPDAKRQIQESYERGREDGERALSEQLIRQRGELIELQNGVLKSLNESIATVTAECEQAMIALSLEIAGKLVAEIPVSTEMVEAAVREALASVEQNSRLVVLLNPMDFELLQSVNASVLLTDVGGERMKFQVSPQVTRGGCMIQTNFGIVDARRETKLAALKQSLQA
jgi:flagellar assembly protein FliH